MDIMINKYVAVVENEYDDGLYGTSIVEFIPFQSQYLPEIINEKYRERVAKFPFKSFKLLDTNILIAQCVILHEILTIQEWFTKYSIGIKTETREQVDERIKKQYV